MNTSNYVYILQALRSWLDEMHRQNYNRSIVDPDEEEFMLQVSMCFDRCFDEYQKMYDPNTNMVEPELLRWETWQGVHNYPNELEVYLPKDKHDVEGASALTQLPFATIEPCLPQILTWLQDINWPVAHVIIEHLRSLKGKLVPALKKVLITARQTNDQIWSYNLVEQLVEDLDKDELRTLEDELCYLVNSPDEELSVMILGILAKNDLWDKDMIRKWARIKRTAYAEWIEQLDSIID